MKTATAPLQTLIESGQFFKADLYTITLLDSTVIRYTDADINLVWGGNTFTSFRLVRDKIKVALGFSVDQMSMTLYPRTTDLLAGLVFGGAVRAGALDGALILLQKAYLSAWPTIVGVLHGLQGNVSDIDGSRTEFKISVKSSLELLNTDMPRNVFQSTCVHTVYDAGCTLVRATYTVTGTVTGTPTVNSIASALGQATGYFDQGVLAFTSGANNGSRRTVKHFTGGGFTFALPLPVAPSAGDTFSVYPGCDRLQATCGTKFSNTAHFKGFPYIPVPETAF